MYRCCSQRHQSQGIYPITCRLSCTEEADVSCTARKWEQITHRRSSRPINRTGESGSKWKVTLAFRSILIAACVENLRKFLHTVKQPDSRRSSLVAFTLSPQPCRKNDCITGTAPMQRVLSAAVATATAAACNISQTCAEETKTTATHTYAAVLCRARHLRARHSGGTANQKL